MQELQDLAKFMDDNSKSFFHPDDITKYLVTLISKIGSSVFLSSPKQKRYRELFVGSLFVYALREFNKREYQMRSPEDDPPDIEIARFHLKGKVTVFSVEIVEIPNEIDGKNIGGEKSLEILHKKKLSDNYSIENTELLIFINSNNATEIKDYLIQAEEMQNQSRFKGVWCIFFTRIDAKDGFEYVVQSIKHPETIGTFETKKIALKGIMFPDNEGSFTKEKVTIKI